MQIDFSPTWSKNKPGTMAVIVTLDRKPVLVYELETTEQARIQRMKGFVEGMEIAYPGEVTCSFEF